MNPIYFLPESRQHPLVRGQYALDTEPIDECLQKIYEWIDARVPGGYMHGFSRMGKSRAQQFWIEPALNQRYGGTVPIFRLVCKRHDRFSEIQFLSELLGASDHKYSKAGSRQLLMERLTRQYSTCARNTGGNHIVLIIDEAQYMHDAEYTTLCNLQNELDNLGYLLTVISVGSHELSYQYEAFLESGEMHHTGRFMVREAKFRGISCESELNFVLDGYDSLTEWPEASGRSYTSYFLPQSFEAGFRMAKYSESLWSIFRIRPGKCMVDGAYLAGIG